jgi:hypothetical protein
MQFVYIQTFHLRNIANYLRVHGLLNFIKKLNMIQLKVYELLSYLLKNYFVRIHMPSRLLVIYCHVSAFFEKYIYIDALLGLKYK